MLEEVHVAPAFFPRFLTLENGYFVSVRDFALGQMVFRFNEDGELTSGDTLSLGETYYSYLDGNEPRLVSQQTAFVGTQWNMRTVLYEFDAQGFFTDSLVLRETLLPQGESAAGHAFHYDGQVLTCIASSVRPSATINDFLVWMTTYDGQTVTQVDPWDPGPLPLHTFVTSWGILRTSDGRYVLSAFIRGDDMMQFWFMGLEADGSFNLNIEVQQVEPNHLLNGLVLAEYAGSLLYAFTEVTSDGTYGGGAQVGAFPLSLLLAAPEQPTPYPESISLSAFPNPFNATSSIAFTLPMRAEITLEIVDLLGRRVALLDQGIRSAGQHAVFWDASGAASGKYFSRLLTNSGTRVTPLILLK